MKTVQYRILCFTPLSSFYFFPLSKPRCLLEFLNLDQQSTNPTKLAPDYLLLMAAFAFSFVVIITILIQNIVISPMDCNEGL